MRLHTNKTSMQSKTNKMIMTKTSRKIVFEFNFCTKNKNESRRNFNIRLHKY